MTFPKELEKIIGNELYCKLNNAIEQAYFKAIDVKEFDERYTMIINKINTMKNVSNEIITQLNTEYIKVREHYERAKNYENN